MSAVVESGVQTPRLSLVPDYVSSAGAEAVELCEIAGLILDPWEALVLEGSLGERKDGSWSAVEVGLCVPRQNGKNSVLEARELAGLYLLGEELLIHSAQHFKTAKEHFLRLLGLIESTPELSRRVKKVIRTHGEEGIELHGGQRILFFARTKSSGRGFTAPFVAFDEAMFLPETSIGALVPTQSAMPNRQRWYAGSAVDQEIHSDGTVFARVRDRAVKESDDRLAFFEWSADYDTPAQVSTDELADRTAWAQANPGLGIRITEEAVEEELRSLDPRTFAVERLGIGDWPDLDTLDNGVISQEAWAELTIGADSQIVGPLYFAFDVSPDRTTSIAVCGRNADGLLQVEIVDHRPETGWAVARLNELDERHGPDLIVCDGYGPAGSLLSALQDSQVEVRSMTASEHAQACGMFVDAVQQKTLRHLGSVELRNAVKGAAVRTLQDAWAFSRKNSSVDISPLVAVTFALWAATTSTDTGGEWAIY